MPEPTAKKARKARGPPPPPEYEDVWLDVYLAGTEWDQLASVHDHEWDFSHLDAALTDGKLSSGGVVHLFGCTEPQLIPASEADENGTLVVIPVIVAILSKRPPPAMVGIKSVQRAEEEIAAMSTLRMGWHARPADNAPRRAAPPARVFVLKCSERRARLKNMDEAAVHKYDYVLPWVLKPGGEGEAPETNVQVLVDGLEGLEMRAPVMLNFDYEMDTLDEAVAEAVEDNELDEGKHAARVKEAIQTAVCAHKTKQKEEREAHQKRVDEISPEDRESLTGMKVFKFYPSNEEVKFPDVSGAKSRYINRYYGQADEIL
jgi:hypothetical protein